METLSAILIFVLLSSTTASSWTTADVDRRRFNVLDYGAVSSVTTDNSQAFLRTWRAACTAEGKRRKVVIPKGNTFLVNPLIFSGPCKASSIIFRILGEIVAPASPSAWKGHDQSQWLAFRGVNGLDVSGRGKINGRGRGWWKQSCRDHPGLKGCTSLAPTAVKFLSCNRTSLSDITFVDSAQAHILTMSCHSFHINNLKIVAPEHSPYTDGIHVQFCRNLTITNTTIGTGDDCISIGDYTSDVKISHVRCGPGHGISIGSLGRRGNTVQVENIHVSRVNFTGTTNGARIKTWQVGKGYVRGVRFEDLNFNSVENPIVIDQNYCEVRGACKEQKTGVHISNVTFKSVHGTSSTDAAISLNCSRAVGCTGISLESVHLSSVEAGQGVTANCVNAHGVAIGVVKPVNCLKN